MLAVSQKVCPWGQFCTALASEKGQIFLNVVFIATKFHSKGDVFLPSAQAEGTILPPHVLSPHFQPNSIQLTSRTSHLVTTRRGGHAKGHGGKAGNLHEM